MIRKKDLSVLIAQEDEAQEKLLRTAAAAIGMTVNALDREAGLLQQITPLERTLGPDVVLLVDVARLARGSASIADALAELRARLPHLRIVFTLCDSMRVTNAQKAWAQALGAAGLFANASAGRIAETVVPIMQAVLNADAEEMTSADMDTARMADYLRVLGDGGADSNSLEPYHATIMKLERDGVELHKLVKALRSEKGFKVADRRYRLKTYPACFVSSEAVDVLMKMTKSSRGFAVLIGQALQRMGLIYHVAASQEFQDAEYFFRSAARTAKLREISLLAVSQAMRAPDGVPCKNRSYLGRVYPNAFIGSEAVDWLTQRFGLDRFEAITVGQQLRQLHQFRHVTDDHEFVDFEYFYCFC